MSPEKLIQVVNKHQIRLTELNDTYIGRGSALGNPYRIDHSCTRERAIHLYEGWIQGQIKNGSEAVLKPLNKIKDLVLKGETIRLVCFCKPKACHGDIVKRLVCDAIKLERASKDLVDLLDGSMVKHPTIGEPQ